MSSYWGPATITTRSGETVPGEVIWRANFDGLWSWNGVFWVEGTAGSLFNSLGEPMILEHPDGSSGEILVTTLVDDVRAVFTGSGPFPGKKEETNDAA
jgi:hypothetical protein